MPITNVASIISITDHCNNTIVKPQYIITTQIEQHEELQYHHRCHPITLGIISRNCRSSTLLSSRREQRKQRRLNKKNTVIDTEDIEFFTQQRSLQSFNPTPRPPTPRPPTPRPPTPNVTPAPVPAPAGNTPVARPDSASVPAGGLVFVAVLANDTPAQGQTLTISSVTATSNGDCSIGLDLLEVVYSPNPGYTGTDFCGYEACDAIPACDNAFVTFTVGLTGIVTKSGEVDEVQQAYGNIVPQEADNIVQNGYANIVPNASIGSRSSGKSGKGSGKSGKASSGKSSKGSSKSSKGSRGSGGYSRRQY